MVRSESSISLVVTDLDGTFWFGHAEAHPESVAAWRELERRGVPVMVATGRRVASARDPLARYGLAPAAAVLNGALVLDLSSGHRYSQQAHSVVAARRILAAFRGVGMEPCVYVDHTDFDVFVGEAPSTHPEHLASLGTTVARSDLDDVVTEAAALMFGVIGYRGEGYRALAESLVGVAEVHIAPDDQWDGFSCTVTPIGLSKWHAIDDYCRQTGRDSSRVLAIGDGPNDLELLRGAQIAVVTENGCADALALADHVVPSPRSAGWAQLLDLV